MPCLWPVSMVMETRKDPACTLMISYSWVARLFAAGFLWGKATQICHGRNSHWDNTKCLKKKKKKNLVKIIIGVALC